MKSPAFDQETRVAVQAAQEAARLILQVYATDFAVEFKDAREPVTMADKRANALLCERIGAAFPDDAIVAEESVPHERAAVGALSHQRRVWFIDPLDGTKEFIARNGEFAVMLGLAVEGRSKLGVIATPATGEVWIGVADQGAYRIGQDGKCEPLHVSQVEALANASLVMSRSHRPGSLLRTVDRLPVARRLPCGSVGVKAVRIATTQADLYVYMHERGGAKLWDACAPEALVRGAGGRVTDAHGAEMNYATDEIELVNGFVASNGRVHDEVTTITAEAMQAR